MKRDNRRSITKEQFENLVSFGGWEQIHDVPRDQWPLLPAPFFHPDTVAVVTSGILSGDNSISMHGIDNIVGGIDWLRFEPEEKRYPGETAGNAYHFVITESSDNGHFLYGPYITCLPIPHHFDNSDLPAYIDRLKSPKRTTP
ncbi:MAG TPA: hypothetical protein VMX33_13190 [bacterium]|nr:hypothetical protein [bacterium]